MSELDRLALGFPCPYCSVVIGAWCIIPRTGRRAINLHAGRTTALWRAYIIGLHRGERHVVDMIDAAANPQSPYATPEWLEQFLDRIRQRELLDV